MNRAWIKCGVFCLLMIGVGLGLYAFGIDLTQITPGRVRHFILSFGAFAPLVYLVVYGQPLVPLPASVLTLTGGLAFGPLWGMVAALTGATIRGCGQFLIARFFGRDVVERFLKGKLARLDQHTSRNGFQTVLLVRLIPNFPYDIQNYGLGFSRVRFGAYAAATFLGMLPGTFALVYLGYSLTDPKQVWKLAVAIIVIVAVMILPKRWQRRHPDRCPMTPPA